MGKWVHMAEREREREREAVIEYDFVHFNFCSGFGHFSFTLFARILPRNGQPVLMSRFNLFLVNYV